ncbi:hypothetical protein GJV26_28470 [Massilia dura]|uniref:RHS repeat protein n=1 Tax=Pseudoduganella dura TaxID=321982 RepID=A0A6I3XRC8_9BURK|nr:RHS repeat-associated core domain-containing protein [Pseudoduganella dura]MUI16361.1 hypothetical protein [Pseudoduganella dura]GGX86234.1 hypothetical protein GCM10007386_16290 [Pseudoduganella dura]
MTMTKLRLSATLRSGLLALATWSLSATQALACGEGGGVCTAGKDAASQPPAVSINVGAGNPINIMSGNKYLREEDMPALPGVLGLEIVRHYNSVHSGVNAVPGSVGRGWKLSYETQMLVAGGGMQVLQADGAVIAFSRDMLRPGVAVAANPANGVIHVKRRKSGSEYVWRWIDGRELTFDTRGKLVQIQAPTGEVLSLLYDTGGLLVKVTDPQGRSLRLAYLDRDAARRGDRFRGVQSIDSPVGRFVYEYGSSAPKGTAVGARQLLANLVRVRHPEQAQVRQYHYESPQHPTYVTGISVGEQRFATYGYNAAGKGILSTHANDADKVTLDYERPGLTTVTNSLHQKTSYRYAVQDGDYRLGEVRGPGCVWCGPGDRRYGYDRDGQLIEVIGLDGQGVPQQSVRTDTDHFGRPVRVTRTVYDAGNGPPSRLIARYEYADRRTNKPTLVARPSVVPGREATQRISYNASGQPVSVTEQGWSPAVDAQAATALERTTRYRYRTVNGRSVLAEIDGPLPNGRTGTPADSDVTRFYYDDSGSHVTRTVAPGNLVTEVRARDAAMRPLVTVSTDSVRLVMVEEQLAPSGQVLKRTESAWLLDAKGAADPGTRQVAVRTYRYDAQGQLQAETAPGQGMTHYRHDDAGNLVQRIAADGSSVLRSFDTERQLTAETRYGPANGGGVVQRFDVDDAQAVAPDWRTGRMEQRWADALQTWNASYQLGEPDSAAAGKVEEATRPDGTRVRRWFDDFGRIAATQSPEHGLRTARYDSADGLVALRDALGVRTTIVRDVQGRMMEVQYTDPSGTQAQRTVLRYAGLALVSETRFGRGILDNRIEWRNDVWGRPSGKRLTVFDAQGRAAATMETGSEAIAERGVVRKTLPGGIEVSYLYDPAGRVSRVELAGRPLLTDVRHAMTLDGMRPVYFNYGNGRRSETRYNSDGMLASHLTGTDLISTRYDSATRSTWFERRPAPALSAANAAGGWRSLVAGLIGNANASEDPAARVGSGTRVTYDSHGRLVEESRNGAVTLSAGYDPLGNRVGAPSLEVDATGNVLAHGKLRLVYNAAGELERVDNAAGSEIASYRYDAQRHRVAKKAAGSASYYMYDDGQLIAEANAQGKIVAAYVYLGRRPVARVLYAGGPGGSWLPSRAPPVVEYLHTDSRDAVETVTDANGKLVWRGELDAFGVLRAESGAEGTMPLRLSGQYADAETGLYYNVHRYYDPAAGRYLQADPLGLQAGLNMYAYVGNDPLNKRDPLGLSIEPDNGWGTISAPWLFGTFVHSAFANQVRAFSEPGWGANDGANGIWKNMRPDAYQRTPATGNSGVLWELKPSTWQNGPKYAAGLAEVTHYINGGKATKDKPGGCWVAGSGSALVTDLKPDVIVMNGEVWDITYVADAKKDDSGLIFYNKAKRVTKEKPATAPAPALSKAENDALAKQMQDMRTQGAAEGWSTLQIIGMVVLVAAVIALMIAAAIYVPGIVAGIIAGLGRVIAASIAKKVPLATGLALMFGLNPSTVGAQAEVKGDQKQKGLLDGTIEWFKSWF